MARLSTPIAQIKSHYTVVIVGSGYGGGIAASRLARAKAADNSEITVCVLERGKEFQPGELDQNGQLIKKGDYPDSLHEALPQVQMDSPSCHVGSRTGLYDVRMNEEISVFVGCGLGGTSLVNANVCAEAEPKVFEQSEWPAEIRSNQGRAELQEGYKRARAMLRPTRYDYKANPEKYPPLAKLEALAKSAAFMGEEFYPLPINVNFDKLPGDTNHVGVDQRPCVGCGDCMTGCNYRAKNTVIMNYLPDAKNHGAEIFTGASVRYLEPQGDRWLVHYQILQTGREAFTAPTKVVSADVVVLGAGSLGSTEILLRSKARGLSMSDALGNHFTGNGDVLGLAYNCDQEINGVGFGELPPNTVPKVGPTITGIIDMRNQPRLEDSLVIEDGSMAGAYTSLLPTIFATAAALTGEDTDSGWKDEFNEHFRTLTSLPIGGHRGALRNTQTLLVMAHDNAGGRLYLEDDRLRITWPELSAQPIFKKITSELKEATTALGGIFVKNPVSNQFMGQDLITVHPLGGCVMTDDATGGVVNHKGQVFSGQSGKDVYENLYVNDGSVIPRSVGINPLLTISAIAERCCALMATDRNWTIDVHSFEPVVRPPLSSGDPMSTQTKPGVTFRETMTGGFMLGETDPRTGEKKGNAAGIKLSIHCDIDIKDVYAFMNDPQHYAPISGQVDFPPFGMNIPAPRGLFNLFSPSGDPKLKHMVYELAFEHEGKPYYLAGKKDVRDDPGFDWWADITTNYTRIYEGNDATGPVIAAGVIYIGRQQLIELIPTIKATNTSSPAENLKVLADFGHFFFGSVWDTFSKLR